MDQIQKYNSNNSPEVFIKSGVLPKHIKTVEDAIVIAKMGEELGMSPVVALNNLILIDGKITIPASAMAGLLRKRGIIVKTLKDKEPLKEGDKTIDAVTQLLFIRDGVEELVTYTWKDAAAAGLTTKTNWVKYPRQMLWWRCFSMGARRIASDILLGLYETSEILDTVITKDVSYTIEEDDIKFSRND
jgi:hypothetical protein